MREKEVEVQGWRYRERRRMVWAGLYTPPKKTVVEERPESIQSSYKLTLTSCNFSLNLN